MVLMVGMSMFRPVATCGRSLHIAPTHLPRNGSIRSLIPPTRNSSSSGSIGLRPFSSNAPATSPSYYDKKNQAKEYRRKLFENKMERKERVKTRRATQPRDELRREFRSFFIQKKVDDEYMDRKARQAGLDWKVNVAVILERQNVVLPDKEDWEKEFDQLKTHMARYGKMFPKGLYDIDYESDNIAMTEEEILAMLPEGYKPAPRETLADETGDVRTTDRKLKTSIYLTVQENGKWMLPTDTVKLDEGETFLDAAKRVLQDKVGPEVEYWSITNCPCAVDMVALPVEERTKTGLYGTKTFFMKLQYDEGQVEKKTMKVEDYAWLDRGEITEKMRADYGDYVAKFYHYLM